MKALLWDKEILIIGVGGGESGTIVTYIDDDGALDTADLDTNRVSVDMRAPELPLADSALLAAS